MLKIVIFIMGMLIGSETYAVIPESAYPKSNNTEEICEYLKEYKDDIVAYEHPYWEWDYDFHCLGIMPPQNPEHFTEDEIIRGWACTCKCDKQTVGYDCDCDCPTNIYGD